MKFGAFEETIPVSLSIGDVNSDGFPDVLAIIEADQSIASVLPFSNHPAKPAVAGTQVTRVILLENTPCPNGGCTTAQSNAGRRTVKLWHDESEMANLYAVQDARRAVFFDFDEKVCSRQIISVAHFAGFIGCARYARRRRVSTIRPFLQQHLHGRLFPKNSWFDLSPLEADHISLEWGMRTKLQQSQRQIQTNGRQLCGRNV
jgi:hypothetical protein